tara:strand:- start:400 stop:681 length:282 start_codon:yes stop_codon:yes gene_type:complete
MKKIITLLSLFSFTLIMLTFLNYEIDSLDRKILNVNSEIKKLKYNFNFLESEWEVVSSPENIEKMSEIYFDHDKAILINKASFLNLLNFTEER